MEFWLDTADLKLIKEASKTGILAGVTTNPNLICKTGFSLERVLKEILEVYEGPIAVQVLGRDQKSMMEQAEQIVHYSNKIIVKIPAIKEGYATIKELTSKGIFTMATAVFEPFQVLFAAQAGANYAAPYLSRIENDAIGTLKTMQRVLSAYNLHTKIIAASIRSVDQVMECLECGIPGITLKEDLFKKCLENNLQTESFLEQFENEWKKVPKSTLFSF